jgi:hypothetical protein
LDQVVRERGIEETIDVHVMLDQLVVALIVLASVFVLVFAQSIAHRAGLTLASSFP